MILKEGDKVVLKAGQNLSNPHWKAQERGIGILTTIRTDWVYITWGDRSTNCYRHLDVEKVDIGEIDFEYINRKWRKK
jgi:hypothetical protein